MRARRPKRGSPRLPCRQIRPRGPHFPGTDPPGRGSHLRRSRREPRLSEPEPRPVPPALLLGVGALLIGWCLFLNRIALGGPLGEAPGWVEALALPLDRAWAALFGPLARDVWEVTGQRVRLTHFLRATALASFVTLAFAGWVLRARRRLAGASYELLLVVAIVARILPVASPPLLETDPYRYLWDGAVLVAGENPYRVAPRRVLDASLGAPPAPGDPDAAEVRRLAALTRDPQVARALVLVNHPEVPTVYPPVAQLLFGAGALLDAGNVFVLKGLVALVDLGVLALVAWFLARLGRPREYLLLYAWCPLVLQVFPGAAHYDVLASGLLLGSLALLLRERRVLAGVLLGLGTMAKVYPVLAGIVLARRYGREGLAAAAAAAALVTLPFLEAGGRGLEGAYVFGARWVKNASLFDLVRAPFRGMDAAPGVLRLPEIAGWIPPPLPLDSVLVAKAILVPVALLALAWIHRLPEEEDGQVLRKVYLALTVLLVTSPVGNPWYLGWILPLAAIEGALAFPLLAGTSLVYNAYHLTGSYLTSVAGVALDLRWLEYTPFYLLLAAEARESRSR